VPAKSLETLSGSFRVAPPQYPKVCPTEAELKPGEKLALYDFFRDPYLFYTNRNRVEVIYGLDDLKKYLNLDERVFLFIQEKDFKKISKLLEIPIFVLGRDSVGHRDILFVSNRDIE